MEAIKSNQHKRPIILFSLLLYMSDIFLNKRLNKEKPQSAQKSQEKYSYAYIFTTKILSEILDF